MSSTATKKEQESLELLHEFHKEKDTLKKEKIVSRIIKKYEPLATKHVARIIRARKFSGFDFDDLMQEARIAILKAVLEFDPTRSKKPTMLFDMRIKFALSSYAYRNMNSVVAVKSGVHKALIARSLRAIQEFSIKNDRPPSQEEFIDMLCEGGAASPAMANNIFAMLNASPQVFDDVPEESMSCQNDADGVIEKISIEQASQMLIEELPEGIKKDAQTAIEMILDGKSVKEIAKAINCSTSHMRYVITTMKKAANKKRSNRKKSIADLVLD